MRIASSLSLYDSIYENQAILHGLHGLRMKNFIDISK